MASLGQSLKEEREARNISLEEVASATKIVPRYLEALEADRLDMMPGGFFIRGIIRTYARAIGLSPDEVLARYKASGLLGGTAPAAVAIPPAESILPSEDLTPLGQKAVPTLVIEEAPKPRLSPAARKRIYAWTWRGLAAVLILAAIIIFWPFRGPRPPQPESGTAAAQAVSAVAPKTDAGAAPPSQPQSQPATQPPSEPTSQPTSQPAAKPDVPPIAEEIWKGITIEITFQAETWIQVYTDGDLKVDGLFPAGATARAQANEKLLIHTGNAGGFTFRLNGRPAKILGRSGQVITDIKITPANFKDFLEGPPTGLTTG